MSGNEARQAGAPQNGDDELVKEVSRLLAEWESSGELYENFARRLIDRVRLSQAAEPNQCPQQANPKIRN